jgi:TRAP-type C4-dicarboxylate transport system permease small subunit
MDVAMNRSSDPPSAWQRALVLAGGGALFVALAVDTLAMLGRHLRLPLLGSIEIVQAAVLVAACSALLVATTSHVHARVHLLLDRASPRVRQALQFFHGFCALVLAIALLLGSYWLTRDLWSGFEESELLHIPYRPLRVITLGTLAGLTGLLLVRGLRWWRR